MTKTYSTQVGEEHIYHLNSLYRCEGTYLVRWQILYGKAGSITYWAHKAPFPRLKSNTPIFIHSQKHTIHLVVLDPVTIDFKGPFELDYFSTILAL